jgi:hypothetical protein
MHRPAARPHANAAALRRYSNHVAALHHDRRLNLIGENNIAGLNGLASLHTNQLLYGIGRGSLPNGFRIRINRS